MNDRSFGRSPGLPIKVAGAGGELDYLANMVTQLYNMRLKSSGLTGSLYWKQSILMAGP